MARTLLSDWLVTAIAVLAAVLLVGGCTVEHTETRPPSYHEMDSILNNSEFLEWLENGPCGHLHIVPPYFNVTGKFSSAPRINSSICLLVVRNTSLNAGLYSAEHCAPIMCGRTNDTKTFSMKSLPAGLYVVMLHRRSAFGEVQGFPVITAFNRSGYRIQTEWHGGSSEYSMAAFSIQPN